jgi:DNA-binding transcriptional MerR regulator
MEKTYRTSEVAQMIGIHPNTVRLYEELELIPKPLRKENRYRVFTDIHLEQFRLARTALRVVVLQNGLRKKAIDIIKTSATGDFDHAINLAQDYLRQIILFAGCYSANVECSIRQSWNRHSRGY